MKLAELFARFGAMARGEASTAATAAAIGVDPGRLGHYNNVRAMRATELATAFPAVAAALGARWSELAHGYFVERPWGAFDFSVDGAGLAAYLARARPEVPAWLPEAAAVEWAIYAAGRAPVLAPEARDVGPARLAPGVGVHRLAYDTARWLMDRERAAAPVAWAGGAVTWQTAPGVGAAAPVDEAQLALLERIARGELTETVTETEAGSGVEASLAELRAAGIVVGARARDAAADAELDLATPYALAPFVQLRWDADGAQLWSPLCSGVIAADAAALAMVADQLAAGPRPLQAVIDALADALPAEDVVELAAAFAAAGLIAPAGRPAHPAVAAGWDGLEAAVHTVERSAAARPHQVAPAVRPPGPGERIALPPSSRLPAVRGALTLANLAGVLRAVRDPDVELIVQVRAGGLDALQAGVYRYCPPSHADQLERIRSRAISAAFAAADPPAFVVLVAVRAERWFATSTLARAHQAAGAALRALTDAAATWGMAHARLPDDHLVALDPWREPVLAGLAVG